ncbi:MAG: DivIVA domain-containing protein [candidate division Zixibacteria bacterium]|nr:DivIVA domain-containing protein [candidate division Zixibacteria bacterium]
MRITPLDIKKQEFQTRLRGFDKAEVISFLEMVSEEMEELVRDNLELKEKLKGASEKLSNYTKIEAALQNTLVATQESVEQMKETAEEKSELIIREANAQSEKIVGDAYDKLSGMKREQVSLENQRAAFLVNFRSLLESQLKLLEMIEKQTEQKDKVLTIKKKAEMTDSDVDRVVEEFERDNKPASWKNSRTDRNVKDESRSKFTEEN